MNSYDGKEEKSYHEISDLGQFPPCSSCSGGGSVSGGGGGFIFLGEGKLEELM